MKKGCGYFPSCERRHSSIPAIAAKIAAQRPQRRMEPTMRAISSVILALPIALLAVAASADPSPEKYEAAYLAACNADPARSDCRCRMAVIEETLSPRLFMQLVERLGGDIRAVLPDEAIVRQVGRRCGDAGALRLESRFPERNEN
jgi:hypothetical protein